MNDENFFAQLRDCFTAGYTMPQFCIDNNIKNPLFVARDANYKDFLWEIYIQFKYDKRLTAQFAFLNGEIPSLNYSLNGIVQELPIKNFFDLNADDYDRIIAFFNGNVSQSNEKIIFLKTLTDSFILRAYVDIPLLSFIQRFPEVKLIITVKAIIEETEHSSEREKQLLRDRTPHYLFSFRKKIEDAHGEKIPTPYDFLGYSNEKVYKLLKIPEQKVNPDGSTSLEDDEFLGIRNGRRIVANQPENYKNKIYFVGDCNYYGYGVPFDKTLESRLQNLLNENNLPYRVENESAFTWWRFQDIFYNLNHLKPKANDIVFVCLEQFGSVNIPFIFTSSFFKRPHNYGEVFADKGHINEIGHKVLAEKFFQILTQNNFFHGVDFKYLTPPRFIALAYRKKISPRRKIFLKTKNSKNTSKNFAKKDFRSARLS